MKHTMKITLLLVFVFLCAQVVGLIITNQYLDREATLETGNYTWGGLPLNMARPEVEEKSSVLYILGAVLVGTILVLLLIKAKVWKLWKLWFFIAVLMCLVISFSAFINEYIAIAIALLLALWKVYRPNIYVHNLTEMFVYGGIAAIFVPILDVLWVSVLLVLISIYDAYAVWKSKHMVTMAKFQSHSKVFAGLLIPYKLDKKKNIPKGADTVKVRKKVKTAILGGGDIGFPLLFAGAVLKSMIFTETALAGFLKTLIIPVVTSVALFLLLYKASEDKFYPAMPFITAGCFVGYGILMLVNLII